MISYYTSQLQDVISAQCSECQYGEIQSSAGKQRA